MDDMMKYFITEKHFNHQFGQMNKDIEMQI